MSTGALIAPFAFLGPAYDPVLTEIYTSGVAESLVKNPSVVNVLFSSGLFGDDRLRDLVGRYVTPDLLTAVAAEHAKGRRLLVLTTNLDAKRAMIWNMGVIAASGAPNAVALFGDVLTASASMRQTLACRRRYSAGVAPTRRLNARRSVSTSRKPQALAICFKAASPSSSRRRTASIRTVST